MQLYTLRSLTNDLKNSASLANLEMLHRDDRQFDDYNTLRLKTIGKFINESLDHLQGALPTAKAKLAEAKFVWGGDFDQLSSKLDLELTSLLLAARSRMYLCEFPDTLKTTDPRNFEYSQREILDYTPDVDGKRSYLQEHLNNLENALKPKLGRKL